MPGPVAFDRPLPRSFYARPTVRVARALLGCLLVHRDAGGVRAARLVETEAYIRGDAANHAFRGQTPRNRSMFLAPGTLYLYRIHQVHCVNVVTRPGEAVLLRAGDPLPGTDGNLSGPGRLCRGLGLDRRQDGSDAVTGPVRLLPRSGRPWAIAVAPRVGIRRAAELPLRFAIRDDPAVSRPRPWGARRRRPS